MADHWVVVGVGPGDYRLITPEALNEIREAEILMGSRRILENFALPEQSCYEISGDLEGLRLNLIAWKARRIALLVSGDPGFYSILNWLKKEFPGVKLRVIPGISSMQLAFARLAQSWYDCRFISLHGRVSTDLALEAVANPKVCFLTDERNSPAGIVKALQKAGLRDKWLFIGSSLGTTAEQIWQGRLADYEETALNEPYSVVIVEDESLAL
ncbi:MAG: precorrin-6y C5,15-methyltransferase (decarboxylating) subunit CbiE [Bacillota bacterium]